MKKYLLLIAVLLVAIAGFFVSRLWTSPKAANAGVVCQVVDVPAHWEVRHWIPTTYTCNIEAEFDDGRLKNVSQFYIKPTGDDNHCHMIVWHNLTDEQKAAFEVLHGGSGGVSDYNGHLSENPEATVDTAGYFTEWEDGRADSAGDEEREVAATYKPGSDADGDGICDSEDNCVNTPNSRQEDKDGDGIGDLCEEPIDCVLSEWGGCSATCGGGERTRTVTQEPDYGGIVCGALTEECNTQTCEGPVCQTWTCDECAEYTPELPEREVAGLSSIRVCVEERDYCIEQYGCDFIGDDRIWTCSCPVETPNPDVCPNLDGIQYEIPQDYHIAADNVSCVQFGQPGPEPQGPSNPSNPSVLGASTTGSGQVLGATTMAKTGVAEENIMNLMFAFGMLLTTFGIRKFSSTKVK
jgi:hypothetical protein